MAEDLAQRAADAAQTAATVKNGGVVGGAASFAVFGMTPSDFAMVATGTAACVSIVIAIAGFVANWYWRKREFELKQQRSNEE